MNDYVGILLLSGSCIALIVMYGTYRCKNSSFTDPLTFAFLPPPFDKYFDGWGLSHLGFFLLLGFLFPAKLLFSFGLGVAWELVEYSMKGRPFYLTRCNYVVKTHSGEGWWYGRWQDIVMNGLGLLIGSKVSNQIRGRSKDASNSVQPVSGSPRVASVPGAVGANPSGGILQTRGGRQPWQ